MHVFDYDLIILGAGASGLLAAHQINHLPLHIAIIEKSTSVGGRLATRRIGNGRADHGAQFFTIRAPETQALVDQWLADGIVFEWARGWSSISLDNAAKAGHPRYAVHGGMNQLAKHLANGLPVLTNHRATAIYAHGSGWRVRLEDSRDLTTRALLLTAPPPQALELLDAGKVDLNPTDRTALEHIRYAPALCGLFQLTPGSISLPNPGALQNPASPIAWMADNQRKGISPDECLITVQCSPEYSTIHFEDTDEDILSFLTEALVAHLKHPTDIISAQLKRWRYALPTVSHPDRYLEAANLPALLFAGDSFGSPRVEGALLSGLAAGQRLEQLLRHSDR